MKTFFKLIIALNFLLLVSCFSCKDYAPLAFRGMINKIYEDPKNHYMNTFLIITNNKDFEFTVNPFPHSWEYAVVGDSIIKIKDSLSITIKKPSGETKTFSCCD